VDQDVVDFYEPFVPDDRLFDFISGGTLDRHTQPLSFYGFQFIRSVQFATSAPECLTV
jgi:hypothetical protein